MVERDHCKTLEKRVPPSVVPSLVVWGSRYKYPVVAVIFTFSRRGRTSTLFLWLGKPLRPTPGNIVSCGGYPVLRLTRWRERRSPCGLLPCRECRECPPCRSGRCRCIRPPGCRSSRVDEILFLAPTMTYFYSPPTTTTTLLVIGRSIQKTRGSSFWRRRRQGGRAKGGTLDLLSLLVVLTRTW